MIRLLLADDQALFRQGLAALLAWEEDFELLEQASQGQEAIALTEKLQPDVILMDVRMPICDGVEATRIIHQSHPWIRILMLTTFDEDEYIWHSLEAGALGYILKSTPPDEVATAIRTLHQGYSQLGPTIAPKVFSQLSSVRSSSSVLENYQDKFNERELEILQLLGQGKSNLAIAQALQLAEGTIKNHVSRILDQLGMRSRTQAALWVQQNLKPYKTG
jgi:DNA-binding NarL/FixJ family response regulator